MTQVWIALGSNLGDREENLRRAVRGLEARVLRLLRASHLYETDPVLPLGASAEPQYLNAVIQAETDAPAGELLSALEHLETEAGRNPRARSGARPLDLDLLRYGDQEITLPELIVPHPRLHQRAFVLVPLCELDPLWRHPTLGSTAAELLAGLDPVPGAVRLFGELLPPDAAKVPACEYPWRHLTPLG